MKNQTGINNPNYKHGKTNNTFCVDCKKKIYPNQERCWDCYIKNRGDWQRGTNNPNYKNGRPKCLVCGRECKNYNNKYCSHKCFGLSEREIKHNNYQDKKTEKICIMCGNKFRTYSNSQICSRKCRNKYYIGENSYHWKGGITPLCKLIRDLEEYKTWRISVFKRDNYTCQECGVTGYVEVHHIKEFNIILSEFLQAYNQFSPLEDKETLIRLAITYTPFWELSNGKTLCEKCHDKLKINKEVKI